MMGRQRTAIAVALGIGMVMGMSWVVTTLGANPVPSELRGFVEHTDPRMAPPGLMNKLSDGLFQLAPDIPLCPLEADVRDDMTMVAAQIDSQSWIGAAMRRPVTEDRSAACRAADNAIHFKFYYLSGRSHKDYAIALVAWQNQSRSWLLGPRRQAVWGGLIDLPDFAAKLGTDTVRHVDGLGDVPAGINASALGAANDAITALSQRFVADQGVRQEPVVAQGDRIGHGRPAMPIGSPANWVTTEDYPPSALQAGQRGTTGFQLKIAANGQVEACDITSSSGSPELDEATCSLVQRRARFSPTLGGDGQPTQGQWQSRVRWVIPEG